MAAGPRRRDLWDNPMGTDGFEFVDTPGPIRRPWRRCSSIWDLSPPPATARKTSPSTSRATSTSSSMPSPRALPRRFARLHGPSVCAIAFRVADAAKAYERAISLGAKPVHGKARPDGAQHPGDRGDRRQPDLSRRPLWRAHDLRCRFCAVGRRQGAARRRADPYRPSDPQRPSRAHGAMGRVLRAALQFSRNPLFRHRRQIDRAALKGDDQPRRQDPHPDQRKRRRQVADRRIPRGLSRRGHPAHRARHRRHLRDGRGVAGARHRLHVGPRHLLRGGRRPGARPRRGPRPLAARPHPDRRRARRRPGTAVADLYRHGDRPDLFRDHRAQGQ